MRCDWDDETGHPGNWPLYTWYYATQVLFHESGASWKRWERLVMPELLTMIGFLSSSPMYRVERSIIIFLCSSRWFDL